MGGRITGGRLLCLSAFSGIGGLDLGLERSGFGVIGAIESDAAARRSLALNRPRLPFLGPHDVEEVARSLVPGDLGIEKGCLALLAAGPPCQPFSKAAQWARTGALGLGDDRSTGCLNGLLTLIERLLPHAVLIENVPGFAKGGSPALPFLEERLAAVNRGAGTRYRLSHRVLDAADFGVPLRRAAHQGMAGGRTGCSMRPTSASRNAADARSSSRCVTEKPWTGPPRPTVTARFARGMPRETCAPKPCRPRAGSSPACSRPFRKG